jgi:uncharacterized protein YndB with AHSA1/START domain
MVSELTINKVNEMAPVVATSKRTIKADVNTIWKILTDFENWTKWNPDIDSITLESNVAKGSVFKWKAGSAHIKSTIQHVEAPHLISWTGKTLGIKAIHVWQFTKTDIGTVVSTSESWDGILMKIFKKRFQKMLEKSLNMGLKYLNDEAEKRMKS